jgi:hypothetical protein
VPTPNHGRAGRHAADGARAPADRLIVLREGAPKQATDRPARMGLAARLRCDPRGKAQATGQAHTPVDKGGVA